MALEIFRVINCRFLAVVGQMVLDIFNADHQHTFIIYVHILNDHDHGTRSILISIYSCGADDRLMMKILS